MGECEAEKGDEGLFVRDVCMVGGRSLMKPPSLHPQPLLPTVPDRGPLMQAQDRFATRRARPDRETIRDPVEDALSAEITHITAAAATMSSQLRTMDKTLESLNMTAIMLEDNIRSKVGGCSRGCGGGVGGWVGGWMVERGESKMKRLVVSLLSAVPHTSPSPLPPCPPHRT